MLKDCGSTSSENRGAVFCLSQVVCSPEEKKEVYRRTEEVIYMCIIISVFWHFHNRNLFGNITEDPPKSTEEVRCRPPTPAWSMFCPSALGGWSAGPGSRGCPGSHV